MELNKIYNVDCYRAIKEISDNSIDCIYTDIPYLYAKSGSKVNSESSEIYKRKIKVKEELKNISNGIDYSIFEDFIRVMKKINIYIWCSKNQILDIMNYFVNEKKCFFEIFTWHKTNPTPSNLFLSDIEYCLYFREKGVKIYGDYYTKSHFFVSGTNVKDKKLYRHPTIKPLDFVKNHLINSTNEGDIVLDPFCGSGTTGVACKQLNRNFIGFELNKEYYENAVNRLNNISLKKGNGTITIFDTLESEEKKE